MPALRHLTMVFRVLTQSTRALLPLACALVLAGLATGCVASWNAPATRGVVVSSPPPAPLVDAPPPRPAETFVWVPGYWHWTGMEYAWIPGHWQQPPGQGLSSTNGGAARWAPPTYSVQPGGIRYQAGAWRYGTSP